MMRTMMTNKKFWNFIQDINLEYITEFKKYRKEMTHFTRNGIYQEWTKNKYKEIEER